MAPLISGLLGFAGEYLLVALLPIFTDFSDFLVQIILVSSRSFYSQLTTYFTCMFFFQKIVLRRNRIIKEVVLVEASSILPLPRRLESY